MFKLTRKVEYGLIALKHMLRKEMGAVTSTKEISVQYRLPLQLLAKTLQQLARKGIIDPVQGPNGGYRITHRMNEINMIEFIEILEGPIGLMDCHFDSNCEQIQGCNIRLPIQQINESIRTMLSNMSLSDVTT